MIVSKIVGGLGNQLFQYAYGMSIAKKNNTELRVDIRAYPFKSPHVYLLDHLTATRPANAEFTDSLITTGARKFLHLWKPSHIVYTGSKFEHKYMDVGDNIYLEGYWASENYFKHIRSELLSAISMRRHFTESYSSFDSIIKSSEDSVSIHIRRGDYLLQGIECTPKYYKNALSIISDMCNGEPDLFVFSDDIEWARNNFNGAGYRTTFVGGYGWDAHQDLSLMRLCRYHITANSTFSWWGAWLSDYKNKVVVTPRKWFKIPYDYDSLIPQGWIRI